MAENTELTLLELNGVKYALGKSIYAELDMSLERFVELLERDLYCPTLSAAPTSATVSYTDTDDSTNTFQVGQPCRWMEDETWRLAVCTSNTGTAATWHVLPIKTSELIHDSSWATTEALESGLEGKVDKVSGKGLSTEDFTTALKTKLNSLSNYDDTEINEAVESLQTQVNTLVSGNASTAIESFNEIIAFLEGITDGEGLGSIIASIEQQIADKQDEITDLDTIRSGAALGATALQNYTETDPTVPAWAKEPTKPIYTAEEIGALPDTTAIPTKVSDLLNDMNFTANEGTVTSVEAGEGLSGGTITTSGTLSLATTGIAGTYGPDADVSGSAGTTILVPQITTDAYGRVTEVTERTYTSVNTTYSAMTSAEATAGTSTSNRTIKPSILKTAILAHAVANDGNLLAVSVVSALPSSPDENTLYIIT